MFLIYKELDTKLIKFALQFFHVKRNFKVYVQEHFKSQTILNCQTDTPVAVAQGCLIGSEMSTFFYFPRLKSCDKLTNQKLQLFAISLLASVLR